MQFRAARAATLVVVTFSLGALACTTDTGVVNAAGGSAVTGGAGGSTPVTGGAAGRGGAVQAGGAGKPNGSSGAGTGGSAGGQGGSSPSSAGTGGGSGPGESGGAQSGAGSGGMAGGDLGSGGAGDGGEAGAPSGDVPLGYVRGIIGVGYGGIRILSRDGGMTWGERVYAAPDGGDDENLIRAIAYGKGRWIATGWNLWHSDDGLQWTDHGKLHDGIITDEQIIEGLAYKDGYFYAAGDGNPSRLYRSPDGLSWSRYADIGQTVKHTNLAYRGGLFVSFGDSHTSYQSSDGLEWTEMSTDDATYCEGAWKTEAECFGAAWFDDGFYLTVEWGGEIRRSTTGQNFRNVYTDDQRNTLYKSRAVAEGYVAPD